MPPSRKKKSPARKKRTASPAAAAPAPMVSVAGIRGVVGESLRIEEFLSYVRAFMKDLKPRRLVLGGDTRLSGPMLRHLVFSAAIDAGVHVHDLGVAPTPTVGFMVRELKAGGGIALTASHNPAQWNALKFFSARGTFLTPDQFAAMLAAYEERDFLRADVDHLGAVEEIYDPIGPHLEAVLAALPVAAIRRRKFRVALDACNGAGLEIAQELFKALGAELGVIHHDPNRKFERPAEPLPRNLTRLKRAVKKFRADAGFALDPDADRLAIVDETGRPLGEERTIVLAADYVLPGTSRPVVVNLSTTRAVEDVAARHGVRVERTPIGEAHVVERMRAVRAAIGGEGNGGVILPAVHPGRDAAIGMGLILALMAARRRAPLSEINAAIPGYAMIKEKIDLPDRGRIESALRAIERATGSLPARPVIDRADGLKLSLPDRWVHVRASGTEPILRIFAEAPTAPAARKLAAWARAAIG